MANEQQEESLEVQKLPGPLCYETGEGRGKLWLVVIQQKTLRLETCLCKVDLS